MTFVEGRLKRSEYSDSQLPLLIRRDMGLFGVLNEIANSEEEGKYFPLQPSLVLLLASPLHILPNASWYLLAQPLSL